MTSVHTTPRRLLIVETNELDGSRLARELSDSAYCVTVALSDDAAERLVAGGSFDAAIIEVGCPSDRGVTLLRRLRSEHPETRVIMMSSCGDDDLWAFVLGEGASDLVPMPVRREDLSCWLA